MNYFRAILKRREHSERALKLTEEAVRVASSNYTVWCATAARCPHAADLSVHRHFRRELLFALNGDLQADLDLVRDLIEDHPKTYQLWSVSPGGTVAGAFTHLHASHDLPGITASCS